MQTVRRVRLRARGVVQGVGFRPHVYRLALQVGLCGTVSNDGAGATIEVQGSDEALSRFREGLVGNLPPAARLEALEEECLPLHEDHGFSIAGSSTEGSGALVPSDRSICGECVRELLDPEDRRYRYPFITCTNCGPRFTLIRSMPYDRPGTTMAPYPLCSDCRREYEDPTDRRFHAQPTACPACGPHLALVATQGGWDIGTPDDLMAGVRELLRRGAILGVRGVGGFHLACDATNPEAVARMRARKSRPHRPLAVMAADLEAAHRIAQLSPLEVELLLGPERPIVLARKQTPDPLTSEVAPGLNEVGLMLPYSPFQHLLFQDEPRVLVMTSGNLSGEPICTGREEAMERLAPLADVLVLHDRDIVLPCDDSVLRIALGRELPLRRSRGYAPEPITLPFELQPLLAVGGELKSTLCLTRGDRAFLSQHLGDVEDLETLSVLDRTADHLERVLGLAPEMIVGDDHPGYLSSRWAQQRARDRGLPWRTVQHHHAHAAAVLADCGWDSPEPVLAFTFDGTGYGEDGAVWGGEVLVAGYGSYRRVGHLAYMPLVGGDQAVRNPYRLALAFLHSADLPWDEDLPSVRESPEQERRNLRALLDRGTRVVPTSSMGRLFDALSSLLDVCHRASYEGQAAVELEAVCSGDLSEAYPFGWQQVDGVWRIDAGPLLGEVIADLRRGAPAGLCSARFHAGVARMMVEAARRIGPEEGLDTVALSGGVFQNRTLLEKAVTDLQREGFRVLTHRRVPPNDGGLSLGQAAVAGFLGG